MELATYFQMLARYNRLANQRIYASCGNLDDAEYRQPRKGSFGSIEGLLNHVLLGDRIWMARFEGGGAETPKLDTILYPALAALRLARAEEDARIERFFDAVPASFLTRSFTYINNKGRMYTETAPVAVGHFFNHQTHHRGQVHVMLSQTMTPPPSLDMHRILNP